MPKAQMTLLIPLFAMLALTACVGGRPSVIAHPASCAAILPQTWKQGVDAPEFSGNGDVVGDWVSYADAVTGKLDVANDRTISAIGIVERCEARDAEAVRRSTRGFFGKLFNR